MADAAASVEQTARLVFWLIIGLAAAFAVMTYYLIR